jgi:hypothetical protein
VGGACGTNDRGQKIVHGSGREPEGKRHSEDRGVDGCMGSECILRTLAWGVE